MMRSLAFLVIAVAATALVGVFAWYETEDAGGEYVRMPGQPSAVRTVHEPAVFASPSVEVRTGEAARPATSSTATHTGSTTTTPITVRSAGSPSTSTPPLNVIGSIPYWDQERAISVFKAHVDAFYAISLFWYRLDADGDITPYEYAHEDDSIVSFAHRNDVKVLGLIANLPEQGTWDSGRVQRVLSSEERRRAHIDAILELIERKNFDGINIDYESLRTEQTDDFSRFIQELAKALHARDKLLGIAIHPQHADTSTRGQDIPSLAVADILALMTYNEHWNTSHPGPIASLPWMRKILSYTTEDLAVEPQRIYLGMPLYGYDWAEQGDVAEGIEHEEVVTLVNTNPDIDVRYDERAGAPYFTYTDTGGRHEVWFEDAQSFEQKVELVQEFGLGGIHLWRLGREDKNIYKVLNK